MIDATLLMAPTTVFSPWFPRQADMLRVTAELIALSGSPTLTIELYTKNAEDPGNGLPVDEGVEIQLSSPGRSTVEWKTVVSEEGVQQLLRFRYTVTTGEETQAWALFRLLPACWFDAVSAA
jgi:hypothetical protein